MTETLAYVLSLAPTGGLALEFRVYSGTTSTSDGSFTLRRCRHQERLEAIRHPHRGDLVAAVVGEHRRSAAHSVTAFARHKASETLWRAELQRARRRRRQVEIAAELLLLASPTTPFTPRPGRA